MASNELRLAAMTDTTMRQMWFRHNSPFRLPHRARRSEGQPALVNVQRGGVGVGVARVIAGEMDGGVSSTAKMAGRCWDARAMPGWSSDSGLL